MTLADYADFIASKAIIDPATGIKEDVALPDFLFDYQAAIVRWALKRGRSAVFAMTGLGKTAVEITWAQVVSSHTNLPVLIFAPLAVSHQTAREARKFGLSARVVKTMDDVGAGVNVTNYQKLEHFDMSAFGGVVIDESSLLKDETGHYRNRLIEVTKDIPFRLAATATPAPNDYMELGNHSEFLGVLSYNDMLAKYFTHDSSETQKWRLKGHAESDFWRWMCSWAIMLRSPSDIGFDDSRHVLPPLNYHYHTVNQSSGPDFANGTLFHMPAQTMQEQRRVKRATISDRVRLAASITPDDRQVMWWCHMNDESKELTKAIPGAVEVTGSDSDEDKERKLIDFIEGRVRVLVSKPTIFGHGINLQACHWTGFVGLNHSFEQTFQAIRRFWRFGQTNPVDVHFISAEQEGNVVANLKRKEEDAERMAAQMVAHMADIQQENLRGCVRTKSSYNPTKKVSIPTWLTKDAA